MPAASARPMIMRTLIILSALTFLYLPIFTLIVFSFNESRMVTVWTETSLKWYYALFNNKDIIHAVGISLIIALMTACASVFIGTLAAFVLVRVGRFHGESLFVLLITAPMVLPEVITGLALLLIFVTLGSHIPIFANRGIWAIWVAHVTFCSAYTTVIIRSRFRELDISIEEAAMDLGAGPIKVFFAVILPALMPAEVAAFLLAFTMSMDDLVITSFIAGPDSTTLPMLIFSSVRRGLSPEINALATIIVLVVSIFTFFAWLSMVKKQKRIKADAAKAAKATALEEKAHYTDPSKNSLTKQLSPELLALYKEQAAALAQGQDISTEIADKAALHLATSNQVHADAASSTAAGTTASQDNGLNAGSLEKAAPGLGTPSYTTPPNKGTAYSNALDPVASTAAATTATPIAHAISTASATSTTRGVSAATEPSAQSSYSTGGNGSANQAKEQLLPSAGVSPDNQSAAARVVDNLQQHLRAPKLAHDGDNNEELELVPQDKIGRAHV